MLDKSLTFYIPYILFNSLNLPTQFLPCASHPISTYPNYQMIFFSSLMEVLLKQQVQFNNAARGQSYPFYLKQHLNRKGDEHLL